MSTDPAMKAVVAPEQIAPVLRGAGHDPAAVSQLIVFAASVSGSGGAVTMVTGGSDMTRHQTVLSSRGWTVDVPGEPPLMTDGRGLWWSRIGDWALMGPRQAVIDTLRARHTADRFANRDAVAAVAAHLRPQGPLQMYLVPQESAVDAAAFSRDLLGASLGFSPLWPLRGLVERLGVPIGIGVDVTTVRSDACQFHLVAAMEDERAASFLAGGLKVLEGLAGVGEWARQLDPALRQGPASPQFQVSRESTVVSMRMTTPVIARGNVGPRR